MDSTFAESSRAGQGRGVPGEGDIRGGWVYDIQSVTGERHTNTALNRLFKVVELSKELLKSR